MGAWRVPSAVLPFRFGMSDAATKSLWPGDLDLARQQEVQAVWGPCTMAADRLDCLQGQELGSFLYGGSTVITLFRRGAIKYDADPAAQQPAAH